MTEPSNETSENENRWWETHALQLGKLIGDLLTLEFSARLMIEMERVGGELKNTRPIITQNREGDWVELTALSNKEDLTWALNNYNKRVKHERRELMVDTNKIVLLRDALAHGRQFGVGNTANLVLVKFSRKSRDGRVQVTLRVDMTKEWFNEQAVMLCEAISRITKALGFAEKELGRLSDS